MRAFPAKFNGECTQCRMPIKVGEDIKARISDPWIHDTCKLVLRSRELKKLKDWHAAIAKAGFVQDKVGTGDFWNRDDLSAWAGVNEYFTVQFHVGYNHGNPNDITDERSFETYDIDTMLELCVLLDSKPVEDTDFEAYRQKLLERKK